MIPSAPWCPATLSVRVVVAGLLRRSGEMLLRREQPRLAFLPEPVALTPDLSKWLWCRSRPRTAEAMTVTPSNSPHSPTPLLEVRMMLPRSYRAGNWLLGLNGGGS